MTNLKSTKRLTFILSLSVSLHAPSSPLFAEKPSLVGSRPNIIFLLADDLGYGDVGFAGQEKIRTPHIDRIASEGMTFTNHYAGSTVCTPSRYTLMTGRHTGRMPVEKGASLKSLDDITVAEVLKKSGYTTHFIGKWGLGGADMSRDEYMSHTGWWPPGTGELLDDELEVLPTRNGFMTSFAFLNQAYAHWYYPIGLWREETFVAIPENEVVDYSNRTAYSHDLFTEEAISIVSSATGDQPFYIQLSFTIPHREVHFPPIRTLYNDEEWPDIEKAYASMVTYLDNSVGEIVEAIDRNPQIADNTLIIFSSDNGPHDKDKHDVFFFESSGELRGMKRDLYEGGIKVPTFFRWKGRVQPDTSSDFLSYFPDYLVTFAELAGVEEVPPTDGVSMVDALGATEVDNVERGLYWEFHGNGRGVKRNGEKEAIQRAAYRRGSLKLILLKNGEFELFDLASDPRETRDISEENSNTCEVFLRHIRAEGSSLIVELMDQHNLAEGPHDTDRM